MQRAEVAPLTCEAMYIWREVTESVASREVYLNDLDGRYSSEYEKDTWISTSPPNDENLNLFAWVTASRFIRRRQYTQQDKGFRNLIRWIYLH